MPGEAGKVSGQRDQIDHERLQAEIRATYARLAAQPDGIFDFNRGADHARTHLNYLPDQLASVPVTSVRRFAGAGNPHRIGPIEAGETVLDHGCGAGMDLIIAAHRLGPRGRAIGVDMTDRMLEHAWQGSVQAGVDGWTSLFNGLCEELPVDDDSVDVVISNGVLNLVLDKPRVLAEVFRVLRPGGRLYLADVVLQEELQGAAKCDASLWAGCIAGALPEDSLRELAAMTGFVKGQVTERFDCFRNTVIEQKVPREVRLGAVNFFARKPAI